MSINKILTCYLGLLLLMSCFSLSAMADVNQLYINHLPESGETLFIANNTFLMINQSEWATLHNLTIEGTGDDEHILNIIVDGALTLNGRLLCNNISLSLSTTNNGTITGKNTTIHTNNYYDFTLKNYGVMDFLNFQRETYSGFTYIENYGSFSVYNLLLKDQDDGTFILNEGDAVFNSATLVANGAVAVIEITNNGNMTFNNNNWDVNYGGEINLDSKNGNLTVFYGGCDVSGWSHGKSSEIKIIDGDSNWNNFNFENTNAKIIYENQGDVNLNNIFFNTNFGGTTYFFNNGEIVTNNLFVKSMGHTIINNSGTLDMLNSNYNSSGKIEIKNKGDITATNFNIKNTGENSTVKLINRHNFLFNIPFIDGTTIEELKSIGPEGKNFTHSRGRVTTIINYGTLTDEITMDEDTEINTTDGIDSLTQYLLLFVIVLMIIAALLVVYKKKK